jgi:hypothetical protein
VAEDEGFILSIPGNSPFLGKLVMKGTLPIVVVFGNTLCLEVRAMGI